MEKILGLMNKFMPLVLACATAYFLVLGLMGDVLGVIFAKVGLYILLRLVYIAVGLFGVLRLIEMFKPELLGKAKKGSKK